MNDIIRKILKLTEKRYLSLSCPYPYWSKCTQKEEEMKNKRRCVKGRQSIPINWGIKQTYHSCNQFKKYLEEEVKEKFNVLPPSVVKKS